MNNIINSILPEKDIIIREIIDLYNSIDITNHYDLEINNIEKSIKTIEDKKTFMLDLVFNGYLNREQLKLQFEKYELELNNLLKRKLDIIKQIEIVSKNYNIKKMYNVIQEEVNSGLIEDTIRPFLDEIIVTKINNDRHNIKLDIFLNLGDDIEEHKRGAKHINGAIDNEVLYLENQKYFSNEKLRKNHKKNNFIYNVYIK